MVDQILPKEVFEGTCRRQIDGSVVLVHSFEEAKRYADIVFILQHRYLGRHVRITIEELPP